MGRAAAGISLEKVGPGNLVACGIGCITNPRHPGWQPKVDWLAQRFEEGLRYLLVRDATGKPLAFLEYVPGEFAWRPVDAAGWLFVHCLWVYPRGQKVGGLGSRLLQACIAEAAAAGATGVAALVSDGPWMAGAGVFRANGFEEVARADRFQLVAHPVGDGPGPRFRDISDALARYQGLNLIHAAQCPMLPRSVHDLTEMAAAHGLELQVTRLESAREAQRAPTYYGVYNLVWNGRVLSDHYVSKGRFKYLLRDEILPEIP